MLAIGRKGTDIICMMDTDVVANWPTSSVVNYVEQLLRSIISVIRFALSAICSAFDLIGILCSPLANSTMATLLLRHRTHVRLCAYSLTNKVSEILSNCKSGKLFHKIHFLKLQLNDQGPFYSDSLFSLLFLRFSQANRLVVHRQYASIVYRTEMQTHKNLAFRTELV